MPRVRVLVVDDSALMRQLLCQILGADPDIEVVGLAADPYVAWAKMQETNPDVLTLDVEMPRMDGVTFLTKLMRARPTPVVMISSLTARGADVTLQALEAGAVDYVTKPALDVQSGVNAMADQIRAKVKAAAGARLPRQLTQQRLAARPAGVGPLLTRRALIAIGASTGGTEALREVLTPLPPDTPGIVVVQHMPERFTGPFADRLDGLCQVRVREAQDGDPVRTGQVLIAPGGRQMEVERAGHGEYRVRVYTGKPVNHHQPSVDVLFDSCAREVGASAIGVILTGMGADGSQGLLAMRRAGAHTLAQDEASCVIYGMPREAVALGAAERVAPLDRIAFLLGRFAGAAELTRRGA